MTEPVLLAVDDQAEHLQALRLKLLKHLATDYEIICEQSAPAALARLQALQEASAEVVLLFAAFQMDAMTGLDYLARAQALHPNARRVLLLP
jgi:CheY-like chemotaxis protein